MGPITLSGIGQVMSRYAELFECEYVSYHAEPKKPYDHVFAFIIPEENSMKIIKEKYKPALVMTVCETYPVHENYRLIFDEFPNVLVPSQFCKDVFERQFSCSNIRVFPHWCGIDSVTATLKRDDKPYTFYTIGNAIDPRKNLVALIQAFVECKFGDDARLVIKATCIRDLELKIPGVLVINGLISDDQLDKIHDSCDCYVNCSKSEGVGMGAVEAAARDKPVIITDFGGLKEYVKTPFVVKCTEETVGVNDFLYEPHMTWGNPSYEDLVRHMRFCFENKIRKWDHSHTREFASGRMLRAEFSNLSLALTGSPVYVTGLTD